MKKRFWAIDWHGLRKSCGLGGLDLGKEDQEIVEQVLGVGLGWGRGRGVELGDLNF